MPTFTLRELAEQLGEPIEGDGSIELTGVAEIGSAQHGELSFVANPKYVAMVSQCKAAALIVPKDLETSFRPLIRSSNPYLTFTKALQLFYHERRPVSRGVHPSAQVSESACLGHDVTVMANAVVEDGVTLGDRVVIYPGVYIGPGAVVDADATLYPHVTVNAGCRIGARCILHAGCRIGSLQVGAVEPEAPVTLEEDIELGANVTIAGVAQSRTRIGQGVKMDNLVKVGAGVTIGPHCIIVAQVTVSNGVSMGERVTVAGQVVISEGVSVGDRSRIGAQSVVFDDVPPDSDFWGSPAQPHSKEKRQKANLARLPRLFDKLRQVEDKLSGTS